MPLLRLSQTLRACMRNTPVSKPFSRYGFPLKPEEMLNMQKMQTPGLRHGYHGNFILRAIDHYQGLRFKTTFPPTRKAALTCCH